MCRRHRRGDEHLTPDGRFLVGASRRIALGSKLSSYGYMDIYRDITLIYFACFTSFSGATAAEMNISLLTADFWSVLAGVSAPRLQDRIIETKKRCPNTGARAINTLQATRLPHRGAC